MTLLELFTSRCCWCLLLAPARLLYMLLLTLSNAVYNKKPEARVQVMSLFECGVNAAGIAHNHAARVTGCTYCPQALRINAASQLNRI